MVTPCLISTYQGNGILAEVTCKGQLTASWFFGSHNKRETVLSQHPVGAEQKSMVREQEKDPDLEENMVRARWIVTVPVKWNPCLAGSQKVWKPVAKMQIYPPVQEHVLGDRREGCSQDSDKGLPECHMETKTVQGRHSPSREHAHPFPTLSPSPTGTYP